VRLLALTLLLLLAIAAPARAQSDLDAAAEALKSDPVYVDPDASPTLSGSEAEALRTRITDRDAGPMYVAVMPRSVVNEAGGSVDAALSELQDKVGRDGTFAIVVGRRFRAGSTDLGEGVTAREANAAVEANRDAGLSAILLDFADRMGDVRAGVDTAVDDSRESGGAGNLIPLAFLVLVIGGIGLLVTSGVRRQRREQAAQFAEARDNVRDDVVELGDEIRALDADVQLAGMPEDAVRDYETALAAYEEASREVDRARTPQDLEPVGKAAEEGRWAMACARARLAGEEPPERTAPCFFDPRHGPSSREVEFSPPFGEPRMVPACEADAQRVERGEDPDPREVTIGGRRVPYWNAGPAYAPYMGGFFGSGLLPGLFLGSMLADSSWGHDPGSAGGFGDFGGGGGDFGGGGFGGDFGGGGGFGGGDF
jgi:hypothetical protein